MHERGREGARRAKIWLEATTRARVHWVNPDAVAIAMLTYNWNDGTEFSFDIGGVLQGGEKHSEHFLAEVKNYSNASDQGNHFDEFLAKCYCTRKQNVQMSGNFIFFTWSPFRANKRSSQCSIETIEEALIKHREKALGITAVDEAQKILATERDTLKDIANSLMIVVVSEKQEKHLVMSEEYLGVIRKYATEKAD